NHERLLRRAGEKPWPKRTPIDDQQAAQMQIRHFVKSGVASALPQIVEIGVLRRRYDEDPAPRLDGSYRSAKLRDLAVVLLPRQTEHQKARDKEPTGEDGAARHNERRWPFGRGHSEEKECGKQEKAVVE